MRYETVHNYIDLWALFLLVKLKRYDCLIEVPVPHLLFDLTCVIRAAAVNHAHNAITVLVPDYFDELPSLLVKDASPLVLQDKLLWPLRAKKDALKRALDYLI